MMNNNLPGIIVAVTVVGFILVIIVANVEDYRKKSAAKKLELRISTLEKSVAGLEKTVDTMIRLSGKQPPVP